MSIDVSSIVNMHGQVYKDSGQGVADIRNKFYAPSETDAVFGIIPTTETVKHGGKAEQTRVLQRFQKVDTVIGSLTIEGMVANLTKLKVDVSEYPDDIEDTWAGFLAKLDTNERAKWPFVQWWLNEHVMPKSTEDWEELEVYKGTTDIIATPGTANPAGSNYIGLRKRINLGITAGTVLNATTTTGAFSTDPATFVTQIEDWVKLCKERDSVSRNLFENGYIKEICMSKQYRDMFRLGMAIKYNTQYAQVGLNSNLNVDNTITVFNSTIKIVGLASMSGDSKIFATPVWNKYGFIKRPISGTYFNVMADGTNSRKVKATMDFWKTLGFWDNKYVYTNDNDLG